LLLTAYTVPVVLFGTGQLNRGILLPLVTLPLAVRLFLRVRTERGRALNPLLGGTAKLLLLYGVLFAPALVFGSLPALW
jgi:1,4-dihydroxy-2-naphthoate octaprenyltransferase